MAEKKPTTTNTNNFLNNSEPTTSFQQFNVNSLSSLMSKQYSEQEYIVEGLIPEASIAILSGTSRSYKTYALLHLAVGVASGKKVFGQFSTQENNVLIIDEENGERLLQKRLIQLGTSPDLPVYFSSYSGFHISNLYIEKVLETCALYDIKLVIIDSLVRIHSGDENSAGEMSKVFKQLRRLTAKGISVLITHHTNKQGGYRGSTEILAATDSFVTVNRKNKHYLTYSQIKQRYAEELDSFEVKVVSTATGFEFEFIGATNDSTDISETTLAAVNQLLTENGQLNQKQLHSELKALAISINEHKLREFLHLWVNEGTLPRPLAGDGNTKLYHLGASNE